MTKCECKHGKLAHKLLKNRSLGKCLECECKGYMQQHSGIKHTGKNMAIVPFSEIAGCSSNRTDAEHYISGEHEKEKRQRA
jgi:hypothetical protein